MAPLPFSRLPLQVRSRLLGLLLVVLAVVAWSPAEARRLALVIGNDRYELVSQLEKAGNDADGMARVLAAAGFEVLKHRDLNYRQTVIAFETFFDRIKGGDEVVVFYAGHGVQTERGSYLLPVDIEGETQSQIEKISYPVNGLLEELDRVKARFSLVIIDACRDNPLRSRGRSIGIARGLAAPDVAKGQMVIFSAGRNQKALDALSPQDPHPNGVFTRELLARLPTPGVSVEKVAIEVKTAVERLAATVNHDQRPLIVNDSTGEFFFFPVAGVAASADGPASMQNPIALAAGPALLSEAAREDRFWEDAKAPDNRAGYEAYLAVYPSGRYAGLARANLQRLAPSADDAGLAPTPTPTLATLEPAVADPPASAAATVPAAPAAAASVTSPPPVGRTVAPTGPRRLVQYALANGDRFEGEVVGEVRSGRGVYTFANGDRYEGSFEEGEFRGSGVMAFANGDRYEGGFAGVLKQGQGVMVFANGDRYEGGFDDNLFHGKGSFASRDGSRYSGDFLRGVKQGQGVFVYPNRDRYEGTFEADQPHGAGSMQFANGDHFQGQYVRGVAQGPGRYRFANGDRYEGGFVAGLFEGRGVLEGVGGDRYEGEFRANRKHGQGVHTYASRDRFEGSFRDGLPSGPGVYHFANGDRYTGEFVDGLRHGKGVHRFADGQERSVTYVRGQES